MTPARPTSERPGSSQIVGVASPAEANASRAADAAAVAQLDGVGNGVVGVMADSEAASEVGDAGLPAERVVTGCGELGEPADRLGLRGEVGELRAHVHVQPEHVELPSERIREELSRLVRREAELRPVVPCDDGLVGVRVDSERDPDEHPLDAGDPGELRLVMRIQHDRSALQRGLAQERLVLVVAVDDEVVTPEPGSTGEGELPRGGDVGPDPLLAEDAEDGEVGERLRAVEDSPVPSGRRAQRACLEPERLLAVDDERRPEALGELRRRHAPERERAPVGARGVGEERRASPDSAWYRFQLVIRLLA